MTGRRATGAELAEHHMVVKACEGIDGVNREAEAFAATFHKSRGVFGEMKRRKHKHILDIFREDDGPIIESLRLVA